MTVNLTALTADADLRLYSDATFTTQLPCTPLPFTASESCLAAYNSSGNLYIRVVNIEGGAITFKLDIPVVLADEGSLGAPLDITASLPYSAQVSAVGISYYLLTGLTPGALIEVTISGLTQDVDLNVWSDAAFSVTECFSIRFGTRTDSCVAIANGSGRVYIQVTDFDGVGGIYTINFSLPPAPATQGSIGSPIVANFADLQHNGQVGASTQISYYRIGGMAPNTSHTVQLYNLTADANITVYSSPDFSSVLECSDLQTGRTFESCLATSNGAGDLFIQVESFAAGGAYFSLYAF